MPTGMRNMHLVCINGEALALRACLFAFDIVIFFCTMGSFTLALGGLE